MFGKKAKLRKELDERLTNPLSSFSSDSSFSDILAPNLDFSLHFYNSHRKKITNTPNKVEKLSEDTISKIKEVFHENKPGQKTDIELFREQMKQNGTGIEEEKEERSIMKLKTANKNSIRTILPIDQRFVQLNKDTQRKQSIGKHSYVESVEKQTINFELKINLSLDIKTTSAERGHDDNVVFQVKDSSVSRKNISPQPLMEDKQIQCEKENNDDIEMKDVNIITPIENINPNVQEHPKELNEKKIPIKEEKLLTKSSVDLSPQELNTIQNKCTLVNSIPSPIHSPILVEPVKPKIYQSSQLSLSLQISFTVINTPKNNLQLDALITKLSALKIEYSKQKEHNTQVQSNITLLRKKYQDILSHLAARENHRKLIQEYIHKIKGNLRVYCRVRPCLQKSDTFITYPELSTALTTKASYLQTMEIKAPNTTTSAYTFDRIFPESSSQVEVFNEIQQFIQSALDGESVCVFAYGATGSGKTFTMQGTNGNEGVLPRCASFIFNEKERLSKHNEILLIYFAAIEIYNENVFDLLNKKTKTRTPLVIYSAGSEVNIPYLIWEEIKEKEDIIKYTNLASESRRSDSTSFNATSSRSHAIFQIKIINEMTKKTSMINIIDLAGSERSQISSFATLNKEEIENMKKIQTEANFINKSLSALGRIINLIGDSKKSSKAISIPYRESKLTVVLQNYLKPNAKTVMIVNVAGETKNYNYTKESLNFAANAMVNC